MPLGRRVRTAISTAFNTTSRWIVGAVAQPTIFREKKIHHHREIPPALLGANVRHVRHPRLVALCDGELALQQIREQDGRVADRHPPRAIAM